MVKEICLYIKNNKSVNAILLLAVSIIVTFQLSKSIPVWFGWNVNVVNYYYDIGVNLSIGYIVSTIFYILVVYYPERKKKIAMKGKVSIIFARLNNNLSEFMDGILEAANIELKVDENIETSYLKKIKETNLINHMIETKTDSPFVGKISCFDKVKNASNKIESLKFSLIPFIIYLDNKELDLYLELEKAFVFEDFGDEEQLFIKEYLIKKEFNNLVKIFNKSQVIVNSECRVICWEKTI